LNARVESQICAICKTPTNQEGKRKNNIKNKLNSDIEQRKEKKKDHKNWWLRSQIHIGESESPVRIESVEFFSMNLFRTFHRKNRYFLFNWNPFTNRLTGIHLLGQQFLRQSKKERFNLFQEIDLVQRYLYFK
jgi:hypothetical protein